MLTEDELNEAIAIVDARENHRIEADLRLIFEGIAPVVPLPGKDGVLGGWSILRSVIVPRDLLPVCGTTATENEPTRDHRRDILDLVRTAYGAGRIAGVKEAKPSPVPMGQEEGDPEVLWQTRVRAALGDDAEILRVGTIEAVVRAWAEVGKMTFERSLKGCPGWRIGSEFLPLTVAMEATFVERRDIVFDLVERSRAKRKEEIERFVARLDSDEVDEDEEPSQPSPYRMVDPDFLAKARAM